MSEFTELSNSYRDPEPEPPEDRYVEEIVVFVVWDDYDYYGPDPAPGPWLFDSLNAAKARVDDLMRDEKQYDAGWRAYESQWERGSYRINEDTMFSLPFRPSTT